MARFVSKDGKHTVTTTNPREQVQLRAQGFREVKARTTAVKQADQAQAQAKGSESK